MTAPRVVVFVALAGWLSGTAACEDPVDGDHVSFAVLAGRVFDPAGSVLVGANVSAVGHGSDCSNVHRPGPDLDSGTTNGEGEFVLDVVLPLGPLGDGCIALSVENQGGVQEFHVPARFSIESPGDTTRFELHLEGG